MWRCRLAVALLALAGCQRYPSGGDVTFRNDHVIRYGTPLMPPKAEQLEPLERWQVIHYLRRLQRP